MSVMLLVFVTGCSYFSLENTNQRVYDASKIEVDEAVGYKGLVYRRNMILELFDGNEWVLSLDPDSDQIRMTYELEAEDWYDIESAYANGKQLPFKKNHQDHYWDEASSKYKFVESFDVWFSLDEAAKASCEDGFKLAFIGDVRHNVHLPKSVLQGFLKKAKDLKVAEIKDNCFDFGGK